MSSNILQSGQCLSLPKKSIYAAIVAFLPTSSMSVGTPSPQGGWCVTVEIPGVPPGHFEAIFGGDGQYLETNAYGNLECLCIGTWHVTDTRTGTFEVTSQTPLFQGKACIGWIETVFLGNMQRASYSGVGHRKTFDMQGVEQETVNISMRAERLNPIPATVPPS